MSALNVVLVEPDIPWNTGNIGRTCVATESTLHLVGKLGFSLKDRFLKRAGLDYWAHLDLKVHADWNAFLAATGAVEEQLYFFEKDAHRDFWGAGFGRNPAYLVFGSETRGFADSFRGSYSEHFYKIPMTGKVRSLNLSTAVGISVYEAIRQTKELAWPSARS